MQLLYYTRSNVRMSAFYTPEKSRTSEISIKIPTKSLSTRATAGLKHLYKPLSDLTYEFGSCTNDDGHFVPKSGLVLFDRYICRRRIDREGQSAVLIHAQDSSHAMAFVAIKVMHTSYLSAGLKEVDTLRSLNCADPSHVSHTVRLLNAFMYDDHVCLVFPLFNPFPLNEVIADWKLDTEKRLKAVRKVALHLLSALAFLKKANTLHADIKPENVLVKNDHNVKGENILDSVTLVDFGNAIHHTHREVSLYYSDFNLQTLPYRAPEVCVGIPFGVEIDMWSLGCLLAELFLGKTLFPGTTRSNVLKEMIKVLGPLPKVICRHGKFGSELSQSQIDLSREKKSAFDLMAKIPAVTDYSFASFLSGLLCYCPDQRLTPWQALQHPFISKEICIGHFLEDLSSPQCLVANADYSLSQLISSDKKCMPPSPYESLRTATQDSTHSNDIRKTIGREQRFELSNSSVKDEKRSLDRSSLLNKSDSSSYKQTSMNATFVVSDSEKKTYRVNQCTQTLTKTASHTILFNGDERKEKTVDLHFTSGMNKEGKVNIDVSSEEGDRERTIKEKSLSSGDKEINGKEERCQRCDINFYDKNLCKHEIGNSTFPFFDSKRQADHTFIFQSLKQSKNFEQNKKIYRKKHSKLRVRSMDSVQCSKLTTDPRLNVTFDVDSVNNHLSVSCVNDNVKETTRCFPSVDCFDNNNSVKSVADVCLKGRKKNMLNKIEPYRTRHAEYSHKGHKTLDHHLNTGSNERKRKLCDSSYSFKSIETRVQRQGRPIKCSNDPTKKRKADGTNQVNHEQFSGDRIERRNSDVYEFPCIHDPHFDSYRDKKPTQILKEGKLDNGRQSKRARYDKGVRRSLQFDSTFQVVRSTKKNSRQYKKHESTALCNEKHSYLSSTSDTEMVENIQNRDKKNPSKKRLLRESLLRNKSVEIHSDPYEFRITPKDKRKDQEIPTKIEKPRRRRSEKLRSKVKARYRSSLSLRDPYKTRTISELVETKTKHLNLKIKTEHNALSGGNDEDNCNENSIDFISYPVKQSDSIMLPLSGTAHQACRLNESDQRQSSRIDLTHEGGSSSLKNKCFSSTSNYTFYKHIKERKGQKRTSKFKTQDECSREVSSSSKVFRHQHSVPVVKTELEPAYKYNAEDNVFSHQYEYYYDDSDFSDCDILLV